MIGIRLAEAGWVPDGLVRFGIRRILRERLRELPDPASAEGRLQRRTLLQQLAAGPVAVGTNDANAQHYEVPAAFFEAVLGPWLKYSCGLWPAADTDLAASEEAMLALCCERAGLEDGMTVMDLGCGWGSLSLWIGEHYPACRVVSVSNSKSQREFILRRAEARGLEAVEVRTADVNDFDTDETFDRVLSIEMFEHVRNHPALLARIAGWLSRDGALFVHHFSHATTPYLYEDAGDSDWMARHFFSGGMMPSHDLLRACQDEWIVDGHWRVGGEHYRRTADAWLARLDARRDEVLRILGEACSPSEARLRVERWRLFFLACSELFGYDGGQEWFVSHLLMRPPVDP